MTTRIGSSLAGALLMVSGVCSAQAPSAKPKESYALIAGTIFRDPGFALPGADVELLPEGPADGASAPKQKKRQTQSDARGEYTFRVPAVPFRYRVHVKRAGFQEQEKAVQVQGEERVDASFTLLPVKQ